MKPASGGAVSHGGGGGGGGGLPPPGGLLRGGLRSSRDRGPGAEPAVRAEAVVFKAAPRRSGRRSTRLVTQGAAPASPCCAKPPPIASAAPTPPPPLAAAPPAPPAPPPIAAAPPAPPAPAAPPAASRRARDASSRTHTPAEAGCYAATQAGLRRPRRTELSAARLLAGGASGSGSGRTAPAAKFGATASAASNGGAARLGRAAAGLDRAHHSGRAHHFTTRRRGRRCGGRSPRRMDHRRRALGAGTAGVGWADRARGRPAQSSSANGARERAEPRLPANAHPASPSP